MKRERGEPVGKVTRGSQNTILFGLEDLKSAISSFSTLLVLRRRFLA